MAKRFTSEKEYKQELDKVYDFFVRVHETVIAYLKKHGDRVITEEDNKPERWCFCFLDYEGTYDVKAIRLEEDGKNFYLDTVSKSGDQYAIDWTTINHDMIIIEMLMDLIFEDENK